MIRVKLNFNVLSKKTEMNCKSTKFLLCMHSNLLKKIILNNFTNPLWTWSRKHILRLNI